MSSARRSGFNIATVKELAVAPPATVGATTIFSMIVDGVVHLFARADDGTIYQITPSRSTSELGVYGSGSDGDVVFDGTNPVAFGSGVGAQSLVPSGGTVYTLNRDIFANNLTIAVGIEVRTAGFGVFVKGVLLVDGILGERAGNGGNGAAGAAGAGGAAGAVVHSQATRRYNGGQAGGSGGAGDAGSGGGGSPGNGASPAYLTAASGVGAAGSDGGTLQGGGGGASSLPIPGGTVGANTYELNQSGSANNLEFAVSGKVVNSTLQWEASSSGGGGRGANGGLGGGGGGGGASGIPVGIFAKSIIGAGTIRSIGGNGGNGNNAAGGGGGGGGGLIVLCTNSDYPLPVAVDVSGGTGGLAGGAVNTTDGGDGGDGVVIEFHP